MRQSQKQLQKIFVDGASRGNPGPAGIGVWMQLPDGKEIATKKYIGYATNNEAEYSAAIEGFKLAQKQELKRVQICIDSELIANQLEGVWRVRNDSIKKLFQKARHIADKFEKVRFVKVPRKDTKICDMLANQAVNLYST